LERIPPLAKYLSLFRQADLFPYPGARSKVLALLVICSSEARCRSNLPKPTHRVIALFDTPMILLQPIG
jgi:hypothetical protein